MDDGAFCHHVNQDRNDFYNWIKDAFKENELATRLLSANSKRDVQVIILREIVKRKAKV